MPKISIIIPIYNVEQYLRRCFDSVIQQTFKDFEVIMLNDGSKDDSSSICLEYQKKDSRFLYYCHDNMGLSKTRNRGLQIAKGEYIYLLDSDDYISENALETLLKYDCDVVESHFVYTDGQKNYPKSYQTPIEINDKDIQVLENTFLINATSCGRLYKKAILENITYPSGLIYEDVYFTNALLPHIKSFKKANEAIYYHFQRTDSITHTFDKNVLDMLEIHRLLYDYYQQHGYFEKYRLLLEKNMVKTLIVMTLGYRVGKNQELQTKNTQQAIKEFVHTQYPQYQKNPYLTTKERIFCFLALHSFTFIKRYWHMIEKE